MCCNSQGFLKKIVPFAITFAIGIFLASIFYSFTSVNKGDAESYEKHSHHKKTHCGFEQMRIHENADEEFLEETFSIDVPPPPAPPAPPIAPEPPIAPVAPIAPDELDSVEFSDSSSEKIILKREIKKSSNK